MYILLMEWSVDVCMYRGTDAQSGKRVMQRICVSEAAKCSAGVHRPQTHRNVFCSVVLLAGRRQAVEHPPPHSCNRVPGWMRPS